MVNGWVVTKGLGVYGTDYMKRAVVAAFGWPANLPQDAVYPYTEVDSSGQKLSGANKYTLTFAKGETPPVNGFWSITMYEIDQGWWFVPNSLNKFTVSLRNNPKYNADGSLTLYFQNESPGKDNEANWLPAPKGDFIADAAHVLAEGERPFDPRTARGSRQPSRNSRPSRPEPEFKAATEQGACAVLRCSPNHGVMTMDHTLQGDLARLLAALRRDGHQQSGLDAALVPPDKDTAYRIARLVEEELGWQVAGWKIAAAKAEMQRELRTNSPIYGRVFAPACIPRL